MQSHFPKRAIHSGCKILSQILEFLHKVGAEKEELDEDRYSSRKTLIELESHVSKALEKYFSDKTVKCALAKTNWEERLGR